MYLCEHVPRHKNIRGKTIGLTFVDWPNVGVWATGALGAIGAVVTHALAKQIAMVNVVPKLMRCREPLASPSVA